MTESALLVGDDGLERCWWGAGDADYTVYHDDEWGRPETGDAPPFEKLVLEGFQAGLSWITILRKRDRFREVFADFDAAAISRYGTRRCGSARARCRDHSAPREDRGRGQQRTAGGRGRRGVRLDGRLCVAVGAGDRHRPQVVG